MKPILNLTLLILLLHPSSFTLHSSSPRPTFACEDIEDVPLIECEALVALYNSANGSGWVDSTGWLDGDTVADWYGVTTLDGHVTGLSLSENFLIGSLPLELGDLENLQVLALDHNLLSGSIPPTLGNLTHLETLDFSDTLLSGGLPVTLGDLTSLTILSLSENQLTGDLPAELGNLTALTSLYLDYNLFTGNLPVELGDLANLQALALDSNLLSGDLPVELGDLTNLIKLSLAGNQLTGDIPVELGQLLNLQTLNLSANLLSGSIPAEIGNITGLKSMNLGFNQLSGDIPAQIGTLTSLVSLTLAGNQLAGRLPVELGDLASLKFLDISANQLDGAIPADLGDLAPLLFLHLEHNQLSGEIPAELGDLVSLRVLWLHDNLLTGDIPPSFANLVNLYNAGLYSGADGLDLDYNYLHVPADYVNLTDPLQVLLAQKDPDWHTLQGFTVEVPITGGAFPSLDGRLSVTIPAGALDQTTLFTFTPLPALQHDPGALFFANHTFLLTAEDELGTTLTTFDPPLTLTLTYLDEDIQGMYEGSLALNYWDTTTWLDATSTCPGAEYTRDLAANTLSLPVCHLTEFALFGSYLHTMLPVLLKY